MELFDYLMQFLLENMTIKDEEFDTTRWSIIKAVECNQYEVLHSDDGKFVGFLTWETRKSLNDQNKIDIGISNLVIGKRYRKSYDLHRVINYLRSKNNNIDKIMWENRSKKRLFEAKQKEKSCLIIS